MGISICNEMKPIIQELEMLTQNVQRLETELQAVQGQNAVLRGELENVYHSRKWRYSLKLANLIYTIIPKNSKRYRGVKWILHGIGGLFRRKPRSGKEKILDIKGSKERSTTENLPKISIVLPVYNVKEKYLRIAVESVIEQTYKNWELCIVDDASTEQHIRPVLNEYKKRDRRIKIHFSEKNGGIATASNLPIAMATGEYIGFLDNDDLLDIEALAFFAEEIKKHPDAEFIYSDHFVINEYGAIIHEAKKPDFSPEFILSTNYTIHFCVYKAQKLKEEGLREEKEYKNVQDIELLGRFVDRPQYIFHIRKPLYSWRVIQSSVAANIYAKNDMVKNSLYVFQEILDKKYHRDAKVIFPVEAQNSKLGYFALRFPATFESTVIVVPVLSRGQINRELVSRVKEFQKEADIQMIFACQSMLGEFEDPSIVVVRRSNRDIMQAIQASGAKNVVFLTNDVENFSLELLRNLIGYANLSEEIGACGGKVLSLQNTIIEGAFLLYKEFLVIHEAMDGGSTYLDLCASNCSAVTGMAVAIRAEIYVANNGFDFDQYGDLACIDFCMRLRQKDMRIVYNARAEVHTHLCQRFFAKRYYHTEEYDRLYNSHSKFLENDPYGGPY